MSNRFIFHTPF